MLTVDLKVNGNPVGFLSILNIGSIEEDEALCAYEVEYYVPTKGLKKTTIMHKQSDGALMLVMKAMEELKENPEQQIDIKKT